MKEFLLALMITAFSIPAVAQDGREETLPDDVMEQVVFRIIANQIKAPPKQKVVYLSERMIRAEWLPEIRNVNFVLLNAEQVAKREEGVYLFNDLRVENGEYAISFGFGNHCRAMGAVWRFHVTDDGAVVNLRARGGWGSGCSDGQGNGTNER